MAADYYAGYGGWHRHAIRLAIGIFVVLITFAVVFAIHLRLEGNKGPASNGSTDGRYHTCGYVTDRGVTEHLDAYKARCGNNLGQ